MRVERGALRQRAEERVDLGGLDLGLAGEEAVGGAVRGGREASRKFSSLEC